MEKHNLQVLANIHVDRCYITSESITLSNWKTKKNIKNVIKQVPLIDRW